MAEAFMPLAAILRGEPAVVLAAVAEPASQPPNQSAVPAASDEAPGFATFEELARVRVAASEAFERAAARLLRALASEVLARELELAACDLAALVGQALAAYRAYEPVALVVAEDEASRLDRLGLPVRGDPALGPGDVVVEVRDGAFESPLAFRLERVLASPAVLR